MSEEEDFEVQIRLEEQEKLRQANRELIEHGRVKKDEDGTEYEWDADKKAWFPKINEDFIAAYNMQYGSNELKTDKPKPPDDISTNPDSYWRYYYGDKPPDVNDPNYPAWYSYYYGNTVAQSTSEDSSTPTEKAPELTDPSYPAWYYKQCYGVEPDTTNTEYVDWAEALQDSINNPGQDENGGDKSENEKKRGGKKSEGKGDKDGEPKEKKKKPEPKWFDQENTHNTSVYVQGLPTDITEDEFKELMSKCGLIQFDFEKKKLKLKLYTDKETEQPKGDGLCTYIKRESVELALQLLDESKLRGNTVGVQEARFEMKGSFNPTLRRKPKNNKAKRREKEKHEKMLDWRPEKLPDERFRSEKTVVLKNMFDATEFDESPKAIQDVRQDIRQEACKFGEIKKLTIYDRNVDGIITVTYKEFEEADRCVQTLNHRWFAGRRIIASNWNGKERFDVKETAEQEAERLRKWEKYLETGGENPGPKPEGPEPKTGGDYSGPKPKGENSTPKPEGGNSELKAGGDNSELKIGEDKPCSKPSEDNPESKNDENDLPNQETNHTMETNDAAETPS